LIENEKLNTNLLSRKNFDDRGIGTLLDGYGMEELKHLAEFGMDEGGNNVLRNRMAILLSNFNLLRGESIRNFEFPDMFSLTLQNEGFTECLALVTMMSQGKENKYGRRDLGACLRNKDVVICPVGALGFHLFERFHIDFESFPDFSHSRNWYNIKVKFLLNKVTQIWKQSSKIDDIHCTSKFC
jgi:hypothetical protein